MAVMKFSELTDPLSLGTCFEVRRISKRVGGDWEVIYDKDGQFLQADSRDDAETLRIDYYVDASATAPARGSTQATYVVEESEVNEENRAHKTISVVATKHTAACHQWTA